MARSESSQSFADRETEYGILPVLGNERIYNFRDLTFVVGSWAIATWCYYQGGAMAGSLTFLQSLATVGGTMFAYSVLLALIGAACGKWGIDHWLYQRALFGPVGIMVVLLIVMVTTWGWFAVNAQMFAQAFQKIFGSFGVTVDGPWLKVLALVCTVSGFLIAMSGARGLKIAMRIMAPSLLIVGVIVTVLLVTKASWSDLINAQPLAPAEGQSTREAYMLMTEFNLAFAVSWISVIGSVTRLARNGRTAFGGIWVSYAILTTWFIMIGVATALVVGGVGTSTVGGDPTEWLLTLGGPVFGLISVVFIGVANITTMAVGVYGISVSTKILKPSWNYKVVATVWFVWCSILALWGGVWEYYGTFLAVTGVVAGPALALIIVDYYLLRRQQISMSDLYDTKEGCYRYTKGFNVYAVIAFLAGIVAYYLVYDPINYAPKNDVFLYTTATGLASIVAAVVYAVFCAIPVCRTYLLRDRAAIAGHKEAVVVPQAAPAPISEGATSAEA